jgi:hypothetical protein
LFVKEQVQHAETNEISRQLSSELCGNEGWRRVRCDAGEAVYQSKVAGIFPRKSGKFPDEIVKSRHSRLGLL